MIKSVHFKNFKALRDATLPLSRFTLIVGPNGSGKSTAMQALLMAGRPNQYRDAKQFLSADLNQLEKVQVNIEIVWELGALQFTSMSGWLLRLNLASPQGPTYKDKFDRTLDDHNIEHNLHNRLMSFRVFAFEADALSTPIVLSPGLELQSNGLNLAGVLDNLRDSEPERFDELNKELGRWLPEFDRILFETPAQGQRSLMLRTRQGQHWIRATNLSHGTLYALAFLTLSYLPNPPSIVCFEEPERGIHPRLFREIRDAMYRLCYPEDFADKRQPVQVIATTHSPYLLDLYKEHPEEIVISNKDSDGVHFERLAEKPNIEDFLQDAPLGEVWYSGILGGVPTST
ncbi:MAG TPA: ATP-binding protein [Pyrinomonadaceae bacterium]